MPLNLSPWERLRACCRAGAGWGGARPPAARGRSHRRACRPYAARGLPGVARCPLGAGHHGGPCPLGLRPPAAAAPAARPAARRARHPLPPAGPAAGAAVGTGAAGGLAGLPPLLRAAAPHPGRHQGARPLRPQAVRQDRPGEAHSRVPLHEGPGFGQFGPSGNHHGHGR